MQYQILNTKEDVTFIVDNTRYSSSDKNILSDSNLSMDFITSILAKVNKIQEKLDIVAEKVFFYSKDSNFYELTRDNTHLWKDDRYKLIFHCMIDGSISFIMSTSDISEVLEDNMKVFETSKRKVDVRLSKDESQFETRLIELKSIDYGRYIVGELMTQHLMSKTINEDKLKNSSFKIRPKSDRLLHVKYLDKIEFDLDTDTANLFLKKLESDPNSIELLFETALALKESTSYDVIIDLPKSMSSLAYLKARWNSEFSVRLSPRSDRMLDNNAGAIQVSVLQKNRTYSRLYYKDESQKVKIFTDIRPENDSKFDICRKTEYFTAKSVESAIQFVKDAVESMQAIDRSIDLYASESIVKK